MVTQFEQYAAPKMEVFTLCIEAPILDGSNVPGWGGEGAGDEPTPGF